jgi:nucleoside phosphorylase
MAAADGVDVLVITALALEFEAARAVAGVERWTECDQDGDAPYLIGVHVDRQGIRRSVALARPDRMGGRVTGPFATALVEKLHPTCLAMSGICAGNPKVTGLGDVIVAEVAYEYDEGKTTEDGFDPDHRQIPLDRRWVRAAQEFSPADLPSHGPATAREAETWLLEALLAGTDPREHPARDRYLPGPAWSLVPAALAERGLIARSARGGWRLTSAGREYIKTFRYDVVDCPQRLPYAVVTGPMASGSGVVSDGRTWKRLRAAGVRTVAGMEMEAATIATVAQSRRVPFWLIAKGVVDHADPRKDDRYQRFAARNSAEVLFALLTRLLQDRPEGGRTGPEWLDRLRGRGLAVWEAADVTAAMSSERASEEPAVDEVIDVSLLRDGLLGGVGLEFPDLAERFRTWSVLGHRKRAASGPRLLWVVGEPGQIRSRALLAALAGAGASGLDVYDAGRDLDLATEVVGQLMLSAGPAAVIGVEIADAGWENLREVLLRIRRGRPAGPYPPIIVAGTAAQEQQAFDVLRSLAEITPVDVRGHPHQRPNSDTGAVGMASANLSADHVYNRGLPMTGTHLFGRRAELATLERAWNDPGTNVLAVVAPGGVGKSALINQWLRDMRADDYRGARKVLAWSFYSQGTRDTMVPADPFVSFALDWLDDGRRGDPLPADASPAEKGVRLAELVRSRRTLLVLDGMEPLQFPEGAEPGIAGTFTDVSITTLLEELARPGGEGGLCVMTTRVAPAIRDSDGMVTVRLDNLDEAAGTDLLGHLLGRSYTFAELLPAVREVGRHALALNLLGRYLRQVHNGDLAGRYDLRRLDQAVPDGGHARRIMDLGVQWLRGFDRRAELAILDLIGLFDRPARPDAMDAVLTRTAWGGRAPGLDRVGGPSWNDGVDRLRRLGLLDDPMPSLPGALDAHPLVRGYSRDRLRDGDAKLWRDGHLALFEHYQWRAPEQPDNAEDMSLLYAAVSHGCAVDLHQEVFDLVVLPRIWRDTSTFYSTRRLGLTGSEIVALSHYFERSRPTQLTRWQRLAMTLSAEATTQILSGVALRLRQVGRLADAKDTCEALMELIDPRTAEPARLADVAYAAGLYCELLVIAGRLADRPDGSPSATTIGERAIDFADRSGVGYFRMYSRTCLAEVAFMRGETARADELFAAARALAERAGSQRPFLYSQVLYRYGYHLIESGRADELPGLDADEGWGLDPRDSSRLSGAIRTLILVAAQRSRCEHGTADPRTLGPARRMLDRAVAECRSVGYGDYLVRCLLERIHFAAVTAHADDYAQAVEDLRQAGVEVGWGEMELLATDIHLHRAALELAHQATRSRTEREAAAGTIADALAQAEAGIARLGYGRRRGWAADLRARLS